MSFPILNETVRAKVMKHNEMGNLVHLVDYNTEALIVGAKRKYLIGTEMAAVVVRVDTENRYCDLARERKITNRDLYRWQIETAIKEIEDVNVESDLEGDA